MPRRFTRPGHLLVDRFCQGEGKRILPASRPSPGNGRTPAFNLLRERSHIFAPWRGALTRMDVHLRRRYVCHTLRCTEITGAVFTESSKTKQGRIASMSCAAQLKFCGQSLELVKHRRLDELYIVWS